jgi:hypothetical protein
LNLVDADINSRNIRVSVDSSAGTFSGDLLVENASINSDGNSLEFVFTATSFTSYFRIYTNSATNGHYTSFDNVSVREMPVLKWAPHNLCRNSEDATESNFFKSNVTVTSVSSVTAPNGTTGVNKYEFAGAAGDNVYITDGGAVIRGGVTGTFAVFAKAVSSATTIRMRIWDNGSTGAQYVDKSVSADDWTLLTHEATTSSNSTTANFAIYNNSSGNASDIYVWGFHIFRSDLGGMVDNPDQPASRASYVPTTSTAVYLPRIGHHVYNGSAWVNEGLLAESEARTNILPKSGEFSTWPLRIKVTVTDDAVISPDGTESASTMVCTTVSGEHYVQYDLTPDTGTFTDSVYVKADGYKRVFIRPVHVGATEGNTQNVEFDVEAGTVLNAPSGTTGTIQDVGNGWYRIAATYTVSGTITGAYGFRLQILSDSGGSSFAGDGTSGIQVYGAQREEASTPSSLIPTSGSSVTRSAETFTIPSANLPWPSPQYIGSELVTNGDFSSSDDWIQHTTWNISGGVATHSATSGGGLSQAWTPTAGSVYEITFTITSATSGNAYYAFSSASGLVANQIQGVIRTTNGTYKEYLVADATTTYHGVWGTSTFDGSVDNISVREINPLSVSIAMDGRITYADEDSTSQSIFWQWRDDVNNRLLQNLRTNLGTGELQTNTIQDGTTDEVRSGSSQYSPDIFVPFDIASRHGSTFVNAAVEGVALTANTTPTALPDLSATDLDLADDYMGTIGTFRVWDRDITNAGLVEATNPSLEPSLSLTFEGAGTNSFVVNDWSE